jgi:hypothetical protein
LLLRTRPVLVRAAAFAVIIAWVIEPDSRYTNHPLTLVTHPRPATSRQPPAICCFPATTLLSG